MGIRIDGTTGENVVSCMSCGEVIYPDAQCIAFQTIWNLPDGRTAVYSNAFGRTIHLCSPEQMAEQVETVISEATSLLV